MPLPTTCVAWKHAPSFSVLHLRVATFFFLERSSNSGYWIYKTLKYGIYACRRVSCETRPVPTPVNGWVTRMQMQRRRKMSGHASFLGKKKEKCQHDERRVVCVCIGTPRPVQSRPVEDSRPALPSLQPRASDRRQARACTVGRQR